MSADAAPGSAARRPLEEQVRALRRLALVATRPAGSEIFQELVEEVARALDVAVALVAVFADPQRTTMRTLAAVFGGHAMPPQEYLLARSPCVEVVGKGYCYMRGGVMARYGTDRMVAQLGLDAYAAFPMSDRAGEPLGLVAVLDPQLIAGGDADHAEAVLKIAAVRLAAELERSAASAALQRSEASYRAIFEASEDCILLHDWDSGRFLDANPKACATYGYTREELLGLSVADVSSGVPPYTAVEAARWMDLAREGRCPPFEWHRRSKDGSLHWDEVRLKPVTIDGRPQLLAVTRDITERKIALQSLQAREEQYRAIFDGSADPIVLWNRRLEVVDVNAAFLRTTGFAREDIVGRHWSERADADDIRKLLPLIEGALAGRDGRAVERVARADGSPFDIELRYLPVAFAGEPHALGIGRDISQALQAEKALRDSEEQHRTIFNASVDGMLVKDADNTVVDVNEAYLRMHGFAREDLLGRCLLDLLPAPLRAQCQQLLPQVMDGTPCHFEAKTYRRDGSLLDVEIHGVRVVYGGQTRALVVMRDITERKRAETQLRTSEEQYRAIFNATADALVLRDAAFRIVDVNAAYEAISGRRRDEVIGLTELTLTRHARVADRQSLHEQALAGKPLFFEADGQRQDGSPFVLEVRGVPMSYRGEPHVLYIGRDVTDAKRAERALRASEEQYRAIFNASADALVLRAADFSIVDVNATYEAMSGYTLDEALGADRVLANPPEFGPAIRALHERALGGETVSIDTVLLRRDGQRYDLELRGVPIRHRGQPHVLYMGRDITQRKQAETALRDSEAQYRAIFNASADALMLWDSSLKRVDVNPAHQKIFGYAREDVVGRGFEGLNWPPEMVRQRLEMVQLALAGEASRVELPAIRKDGRRIVTELRTIPFLHRGEPHVLQIARDITAQRAAQAERAALEAQLRQAQKMEAIGQLTGGIAHDFNNILTSVIGYLVLAQERAGRFADPTLARQLGSAQAAAQRARELIAQMLAFARRQRGDRRVITLPPVVRQALQLLRSTLPASIVLEDAARGDDVSLPPVRGDAVQLEQVLFNLCINARDAMPRSGRITVRLGEHHGAAVRCASCGSPVAAGRWLRLTVSDTGSGIDPAVVPRMFEPFFTTKEVGRGSGMGLAMVHGIVHEHEGHIVVDTAPGRGSSFHVLLPAADGAAEAPDDGAAAAAAAAPLAGRVMVVEDEPMVAAFMHELLTGWGLEVVLPADAHGAMRWFDDPDHHVDLLITDLTMPQLTGIDLAHHVSVLRPDLPVVLYSGDPDAVDEDALRRAGVRAVLGKPVDPSQLAPLLRRWLGAR